MGPMVYCMTRLSDNQHYYTDSYDALYDAIFRTTGNHEQAESMASWAENASYGDSKTVGNVDVYIMKDD